MLGCLCLGKGGAALLEGVGGNFCAPTGDSPWQLLTGAGAAAAPLSPCRRRRAAAAAFSSRRAPTLTAAASALTSWSRVGEHVPEAVRRHLGKAMMPAGLHSHHVGKSSSFRPA